MFNCGKLVFLFFEFHKDKRGIGRTLVYIGFAAIVGHKEKSKRQVGETQDYMCGMGFLSIYT